MPQLHGRAPSVQRRPAHWQLRLPVQQHWEGADLELSLTRLAWVQLQQPLPQLPMLQRLQKQRQHTKRWKLSLRSSWPWCEHLGSPVGRLPVFPAVLQPLAALGVGGDGSCCMALLTWTRSSLVAR